MMRLGRRATVLVALSLLISAATAYAECAWILWAGTSRRRHSAAKRLDKGTNALTQSRRHYGEPFVFRSAAAPARHSSSSSSRA